MQISALFQIYITDMSRHLHHLTNCPFEVKKGGLKGLFLYWEVILLIFFVAKRYFFGRKRPLLCGGSVLLSRHELCRIYALFWSDFDADFYADIEDFVQILCRFLHKKLVINSSDFFCVPYLKKKRISKYMFFSHFTVLCKNIVNMHRLHDVLQFSETSLKHRIVKN